MTEGQMKSGSKGNVQTGPTSIPCASAGAAKIKGGVTPTGANNSTTPQVRKSGSKG